MSVPWYAWPIGVVIIGFVVRGLWWYAAGPRKDETPPSEIPAALRDWWHSR